jgi:hypothetical protein
VSGENAEIMEFNLLPHESDAAATSLLPLPLLSCGPRSMVVYLCFRFIKFHIFVLINLILVIIISVLYSFS